MAIIREEHQQNYTVIQNQIFNNPKMSLKAKGLLGFMLSKPNGWDFSINGLKSQLKEGRDSIASILRELEDFKYLRREQSKNGSKFSSVDYYVYETPNTENKTTENPNTEKPIQVSNNLSKELIKVNNIKKEERFNFRKELLDFGLDETLVNDWLDIRKSRKGRNSESAFNIFINRVKKSKYKPNQILETMVYKSWTSFEEDWIDNLQPKQNVKKSQDELLREKFSKMPSQLGL